MNFLGRSLLDVSDLRREEIIFLLDETRKLKAKTEQSKSPGFFMEGPPKTLALIFFEPSTRTRTSFEMAAFQLGLRVLSLDTVGSSAKKGETIFDTARNIEALRPNGMVIRHSGSGIPLQISKLVKIPVINAGDGFHAHPTQALLDAFTIRENFGDTNGLRVLLIGDIAHSRVARSNIKCLKMLGASVEVCGPPTLIPPLATELGVEVKYDLDECLPRADVVMTLRMQVERQASFQVPSLTEYSSRFGITAERLALIKESAIILHPGPINRGVELLSLVLRDSRSKVLEQVQNGVLLRSVLLAQLLGNKI